MVVPVTQEGRSADGGRELEQDRLVRWAQKVRDVVQMMVLVVQEGKPADGEPELE